MKVRKKLNRKLQFENLEKREVFASNLTASFNAGVLTIDDHIFGSAASDDKPNSIFVTNNGGSSYFVTGDNAYQDNGVWVKTTINDSPIYHSPTGVYKIVYTSSENKGVSIKFYEGNVWNVWQLNSIDISTGSGDNTIETDLINLNGYLSIKTNQDGLATFQDSTTVNLRSTQIYGSLNITSMYYDGNPVSGNPLNGKSGPDTINLSGVRVGGPSFPGGTSGQFVKMLTGNGVDTINIYGVDAGSTAYTTIDTGWGNDVVNVYSGIHYFSNFTLRMSGGDDTLNIFNYGTVDQYALWLYGNATLDGGETNESQLIADKRYNTVKPFNNGGEIFCTGQAFQSGWENSGTEKPPGS